MVNKKQQKRALTWNDFNRAEDDIFQFALRSYVCNDSDGFNKLVSSIGARRTAKKLLDHLDAFVVKDETNNIHVQSEIEQLAISNKTGRALYRISVSTTRPDNKGKGIISNTRTFFKPTIVGDDDRELSAIGILEDITDVLNWAARVEYNDILEEMGIEVKSIYD